MLDRSVDVGSLHFAHYLITFAVIRPHNEFRNLLNELSSFGDAVVDPPCRLSCFSIELLDYLFLTRTAFFERVFELGRVCEVETWFVKPEVLDENRVIERHNTALFVSYFEIEVDDSLLFSGYCGVQACDIRFELRNLSLLRVYVF